MTTLHSPPVSGLGDARTEPPDVSGSAVLALAHCRTALRALPLWCLRVPLLRRPAIPPAPHRGRPALFRSPAPAPAALRQGSIRPEYRCSPDSMVDCRRLYDCRTFVLPSGSQAAAADPEPLHYRLAS